MSPHSITNRVASSRAATARRVACCGRELRELQVAVAAEAHVAGSRLYAAALAQVAALQGELARAHAQVADLQRARELAFARENALQLQARRKVLVERSKGALLCALVGTNASVIRTGPEGRGMFLRWKPSHVLGVSPSTVCLLSGHKVCSSVVITESSEAVSVRRRRQESMRGGGWRWRRPRWRTCRSR